MNEMTFYNLRCVAGMAAGLSTQVARELGRRIVAGAFEHISLLDEETVIAERYQVSRVTVRDAVKILVSKRLVEVCRGKGTKIRPRNQWNLLDDDVLAWHLSAPPTTNIVSQLMDIRLAFEPKAARWAAERGLNEDIAEIEASCLRMEREKGSVEDFIIADAMFHRSILRAARNEFLTAMEGVVYSALLVSIRLTNEDPRNNADSIPFHRRVYEAIAAGDGNRAETLIEELLDDAKKRLGSSSS